MEYIKYLDKNLIITTLKEKKKDKLLKEFSQILEKHLDISHSLIHKQLKEREKLGSTGVGNGIAIPHCRIDTDKFEIKLLIAVSKDGVDFDSTDKKPVNLFVVIVASNNSQASYFKVLSHLARALQNKELYHSLINADTKEEIFNLLINSGNQ